MTLDSRFPLHDGAQKVTSADMATARGDQTNVHILQFALRTLDALDRAGPRLGQGARDRAEPTGRPLLQHHAGLAQSLGTPPGPVHIITASMFPGVHVQLIPQPV